jgi:hypothetical protein
MHDCDREWQTRRHRASRIKTARLTWRPELPGTLRRRAAARDARRRHPYPSPPHVQESCSRPRRRRGTRSPRWARRAAHGARLPVSVNQVAGQGRPSECRLREPGRQPRRFQVDPRSAGLGARGHGPRLSTTVQSGVQSHSAPRRTGRPSYSRRSPSGPVARNGSIAQSG